ncbi:MAG: NADP-dependent oxidoreductase [Polyangiales bacterium]
MTRPANRQWLLARRPRGELSADDFKWVTSEVRTPGSGEVLVRNLFLSCDPTQRGWAAGETYFPAVRMGDVMRSFAAGEVLESNDPTFQKGQIIQGLFGWQDYAVVSQQHAEFPILPVPRGVSIETAMSVLGNTGITAYFGLLEIGRARTGETVVVSAASGATGMAAAQIAKIIGCRTVGIAGGPDKCRYLVEELGLDAAIDYKGENVITRMRELCPTGIDVYYDNVGGRILEAALANLALHGRIVLCGAISGYNEAGGPPGPRNYMKLLTARGRMEGFVVVDYMPRAEEATTAIAGWLREGKLKDLVDVQHGLENAPAIMQRLFTGQNRGKLLIKIADAGDAGGAR